MGIIVYPENLDCSIEIIGASIIDKYRKHRVSERGRKFISSFINEPSIWRTTARRLYCNIATPLDPQTILNKPTIIVRTFSFESQCIFTFECIKNEENTVIATFEMTQLGFKESVKIPWVPVNEYLI